MTRLLYPQGKSPSYSLDRRLGGPLSGSGRSGEEKNSQPMPGLEPPDHPAHSRGYTNELSCFLFLLGFCIEILLFYVLVNMHHFKVQCLILHDTTNTITVLKIMRKLGATANTVE
jgi:hypothetical protein